MHDGPTVGARAAARRPGGLTQGGCREEECGRGARRARARAGARSAAGRPGSAMRMNERGTVARVLLCALVAIGDAPAPPAARRARLACS
jgi:hypothetical protein